MTSEDVREQVRARYAEAAVAVGRGGSNGEPNEGLQVVDDGCGTGSCCGAGDTVVDESFRAVLYSTADQDELPAEASRPAWAAATPTAVAALQPGSGCWTWAPGGGIDVLLSARRVGESRFAYGVDMTDEMLELARASAAKAGATNVEFLGAPSRTCRLPDASVDVVISNCVVNLSVDKPRVMAEMYRVLAPGGRIRISDVVAEDHLTSGTCADAGRTSAASPSALSRGEYLAGLTAAGFVDAEVEFTHEAVPGMHGAIVRATNPAG